MTERGRRARRGPAGLLALALLAAPGAHAEGGWELIDDVDGVRVWRKPLPGSPILALRGEAVVDVPVARLLGVMSDTARAPEWVHLLQESVLLRRPAPGEAVIYNRYDSPWPLQDRDFVIHRSLHIDAAARVVSVEYRSTEDTARPSQSCCVRGVTERARWRFTALEGSRTRVELEALTDPRGSIPSSVVNFFQSSWPRRSILNLAARARRPDITPHPEVAGW